MQKKKISIGLIIAIICLTLILIVAQNLNIKNTDNLSPEMRKALSYGVVEEGDDKTESDNVKFIAYFMKDINGDGKKEKIKGSCNKIGYEDILYMDLSVLSGKLENAKITVNGNNFYLQTEIIADSIVSSDRISENTKDIELKSISGNISKTLTGLVKSGDYAYVTNNKLALNRNPDNYTAANSIVLSGTYISDDGEVININKTVNLTVDWYGDINVEIPKKLYGKNNTYQVKDMETAIDQENNKLKLEFIVGIQETKNETLLKSAYIEGTIPELNGYAPSNVSVSGTNVDYTYDEQNRKFTAKREPVIEDGKITENAYSVTYAENNVNYRANEFNVKVEYPLEAYASTGDNFINLNIPVSGYYEGYNNSGEGFKNPLKSEKVSNYINVFYMEGAETNKTFNITTGKSVIYPVKRNVVSSEEIYSQYTRSVAENKGYTVRWDIFSGDKENIDSIILKDNQQSDEFIKSDGTIINMENYVYTEGIFFTNPSNMLGDNGWIKVYDDDTNELLHEFTNTDWNTYNSINPYQFTKEISHLRVETSSAESQSILMIYKVNQFKKNNIITDFTESDINNLKQIKSYLYATMTIDGVEEISDLSNIAELEREISIANIKASPTKLSTQGTVENLNIEIETIAIQYNSKKWKNGEFILKLPTDTVDFVVNNISISENDNNKIVDYYVYEENNELYLKVKIENQISTQYKILINANIVLDSRAGEKEEELQLYAYNPRGKNHYSENMVADIYDVNKNNDREELVGLYTSKVDIELNKDLLVSQTAYNFNQSGKTIVAPQKAIIENENRTINIDVNIKNNSSENINNIKILGKLPYENNEDLNGNSLNSEINAQLTGAIQIPTELQNVAKIYYSDQENPTKDISLAENNWQANVSDYTKIKNFLITLDGYEMIPNNEHDFSYEMKLPIETTYNLTGYATNIVYYETLENDELIEKEQESHKLGVSSAKQFNMELTKYKIGTTETVEGVTFSITDIETGNITLHTTNSEGKILISNLYLEKEYELREVGAQDEYVLESREIKFKLHDTNGNISIEILNGEFRETPTIDDETLTVYANLENEVKYDLNLNFRDQLTGLGIENAKISVQGQDIDDTYITDSLGNITIANLCPEVTYTIEEKENKGYYIYDSNKIEFKLSRVDGKLQLIINNGEIESSNITEDTGNIKANLDLNITKEKIPTYELKLKLYEQGKDIIVLEGARYKITGPGKETGEIYTTNKNGEITIQDLYQYIDGKYITGEYTLTEVEPPLGYALSANVVKFRVVADADGNLSGELISGELREGPTVENNILEIKLNNNLLFNITKIDGESLELLPNAKFTIKELVIEGETEVEKEATDEFGNILGTSEYINGSWQRVFTTNSEGIIEESIKNGIYKIEEIQAPEGYVLPENEEDRIQYVGIGQKRGAEISAEFLPPLYTEETNAESYSTAYKIAGREDGSAVYYYKNSISLINAENEIAWTHTTAQIMEIIADDSKIITLTDSSIIEYDYNGNILNTYNLISGMNSIAKTNDGKYVIVGDYSGTLTIPATQTTSGSSISITSTKNGTSIWASYTQDIYILKLNSNYQVESLTGIGGTGADYSSNIIVNDDGNYIVGGFVGSTSIAGSMTNSGSAISGTFTNSIIKINQSNNKVIWMKNTKTSISRGTQQLAHMVSKATEGDFYYISNFSGTISYNANETELGFAITVTSNGGEDSLVVKYNSDGKVVWAIPIGGKGLDHIYSASSTADGGIIIGGDSNAGALTVTSENSSSGKPILTEPIVEGAEVNWRGIVAKIADDGKVIWANEFGYTKNEGCYAVTGLGEDSYILAGFESPTGGASGTAVAIRANEAQTKEEISEVKGLDILNYKKRLTIKTEVNGIGGTISGAGQDIYEEVVYGNDSTQDIIITPDNGYEILSIKINDENIQFEPDINGSITLEKFTNITENKNIVVEFSDNVGTVTIHHYLENTTTKVADSETMRGIVGKEYTTSPKMNLDRYELVKKEDNSYNLPINAQGTYQENDQEVIYYYKERHVRLTVHYYLLGTKTSLSEDIVSDGVRLDTYTTEQATDIPFEYELIAIPVNASGILDGSEVVVTYYYKEKPKYEYTIEYYYEGIKDETQTVTETDTVGKVIDTYELKDKTGYTFEKAENVPLTISSNIENNVIKIYYLANTYNYSIEYYYDNIIDSSKTERGIAKYNTQIESYTDKVIDGYVLDKVEYLPTTITENEDQNILKVYYVKRNDLSYTVNYLEKDTNKVLQEAKKVSNQTFESVITSSNEVIEIDGYNYDSVDKDTLNIGTGENIINIYYTKRTDLSYTVNYLEKDTNKVLQEAKKVSNQTFESVITSSNEVIEIDGYNYDSVDKDTLSIGTGENIINIYYIKRTDLSYTVNYLEKDTNKVLQEAKTVSNQTFESVITSNNEVIEINGYNYDSVDKDTLTITTGENIINIYYTKKNNLSYIVNYLEKDTNKIIHDSKAVENQTLEDIIISSNEVIEIPGYNYDSVDKDTLSIGTGLNEINIYYTKKDTKVIVHYYEEGTTNKISEDVEIPGKVFDTYSTEEATNIPSKYELVAVPENSTGEMTEEEIVVIYYYKKKATQVIVHHYEEGTTNKLSENVTIDGKVDDPYTTEAARDVPIKYELVADPENKAGTMTEDVIEVTYYYRVRDAILNIRYLEKGTNTVLAQEEQQIGKVDEPYIANSKTIEGYTLVENSGNTTGTLTIDPTTVTFYYLQNTSVTVNHIDKTTGDILLAETTPGLVGDEFTATSKVFENYMLVEKPNQETVTMTKTEIILNYYYIHVSGGVIEKHIDAITGEILANEVHTGNEGDEYHISSRTFAGYDLVEDRLPANSDGTMQVNSIEVIYYYIYKTKVTTKYIDQATGEKLTADIEQPGHEQDRYTTDRKTFENYKLVAVPENADGEMTKEEITVTYYYAHISGGVIINHIDVNTGKALVAETKKEGYEGDHYQTYEENLSGYDLVKEKYPTNATGTMTKEEIRVTYYYVKKTEVSVKYVDKETGEEIAERTNIPGNEGDTYQTQEKEISGYDLVENPENKTGTMLATPIEVIYYYKRPAIVIVKYVDIETNKEIATDEKIEGHQNDDYTAEKKEIKYYNLAEVPSNSQGKMIVKVTKDETGNEVVENTTYVIYYYQKMTFNLKIDKQIESIIVNGQEKKISGNLGKVEIDKKALSKTNVQVVYKIVVTNNSQLKGNASILENIPAGMTMSKENNIGWEIIDTNLAKIDTGILLAGESKEYKVVLDWTKGETNVGDKENIAQIVTIENEAGYEEEEIIDNESRANIIISIGTGAETYTLVAIGTILILLSAISFVIIGIKRKEK